MSTLDICVAASLFNALGHLPFGVFQGRKAARRRNISAIPAASTLAKAMRIWRFPASDPGLEHGAGQHQERGIGDQPLAKRIGRHVERVFDIGEIGAAAQKLPARSAAKPPTIAVRRAGFRRARPPPIAQGFASPRARRSGQAGWGRSRPYRGISRPRPDASLGDDRADAVAGQAVGLGEAVEVDEGVGPVRVGEKVMRRTGGGCRNRGRFRPR
jgi:hypothetical protein